MEEMGCSTEMGGTAFESFLYQVSKRTTSMPIAARSSRSNCNSDERMYVGMGL